MNSYIVRRSTLSVPKSGFPGALIAACGLAIMTPALQAQFASEVIQLNLGTAGPLDFETKKPYDLPESVLGAPTAATLGNFSAPIDPFAPPYQRAHLLSLGDGGQITVKMSGLIENRTDHPFGLDFTIFGNNGFVITSGDFRGGGITSGDQFGANAGQTVVSVSADGIHFYQLDPKRAPIVDGLFPSDSQGDPLMPVNPSLTPADFAGLTLDGIRKLYAGAWGGSSYDLAWAVDDQGQSVTLDHAEYIRVQVLSGRAEIDAFALVNVPEPTMAAMGLLAFAGLLLRKTRSFRP